MVHHPHESFWSICQTKGHDQPFKKNFFSLECSLPYICLFYGDLVVVKLHINLIKVFGPLEMINEIVNLGNRVSIHDCYFI
jgi:hypothetical protein